MTLSKGMRDRGVVLSMVMLIDGLLSVIAIPLYLQGIIMDTAGDETILPAAGAALFILASIANLVALWGIYQWKWWGVCLSAISHGIAALVEVMTTGNPITVCGPVLVPIIIVPLARSMRKDFE